MPKTKRIILSLVTFFSCLLLSLGILIEKSKDRASEKTLPKQEKSEELEKFFYKKVGQSKPQQRNIEKSPRRQFTVQLGVVFNQRAADEALISYKKKGIDAFYTPFHTNGRVYYRIRYGLKYSRKQADILAKKIKSTHKIDVEVTAM